ncbi:hypothetical protein MMF93_01345 [Streptomyces tubbatahanensis]|uniref:N-sulphoglucosamine sulphohydrolase C-terminal domain-containing protein n=1 Tax=Streptomyces tubbatahanensis TaxID=2923272 RepID=A0ABY3XLG5_9ACTN|nr:hypothetical protein [Streptomyces tubbatahanensis]UNS95257.1 hypothetical protein MMF93_01345 [Streptomyces tubbatahanensis]
MHRQLLGAQRPVAHRPLYFYRNDPYTTPGQAREDGPFARSAAEAVRVGDWKAVRFSPDRERDHPDEDWHFELYDLARDPAETTDVADRHPRQAARLLATMRSEWREPR